MSTTYFQDYPQTQTYSKQTSISREKEYLVKVYGSLVFALAMSSLACFLDISYHIHGFLTGIGGFIGIIVVAAAQQQKQKLLGLLITAFCMGANLGPLIMAVLEIDPSIIYTAVTLTTTMFICLTGAAMLAPSRQYLYLGGMLSSALSMLVLVGIMNLFFPNPAMQVISLYVGLLVFCGYVLYDTQVMLEKASMNYDSYVNDALQLFLDFMGILIRIIIILTKDKKKK